MSRVNADQEHAALTECGYVHPTEALNDVRAVTAVFRDLDLYVDFYCYSDGNKKKLVNLAGTIPIWYEGNVYDIPICIWLHDTHPQSPPKCSLRPSVAMVINPKCSCVDARGHVHLPILSAWQPGQSNLSTVLKEMSAAFQRETPLFAMCPQTPPPAQHPQSPFLPGHHNPAQSLNRYFPSPSQPYPRSPSAQHVLAASSTASPVSSLQGAGDNTPPTAAATKLSHPDPSTERRVRRSYTEELLDLGITFEAPSSRAFPPTNPFAQTPPATVPGVTSSNTVDIENIFTNLQLQRITNELNELNSNNKDAERVLSQTGHVITVNEQQFPVQVQRVERTLAQVPVPDGVPRDKSQMFRSLVSMEGRSFSQEEVLEAVQSCRDLPSALRYLSHECPICRDQVSFSKIITMTHCPCAFCESCFRAYFSSVIKEKSIASVVCPLCNRPDVRGPGAMGEAMDYFSLLDTQIRHYLDPETHELFQRKLRDHALLEMPNFRWCAHCSFGLLHEADRLRMDCPSCKKSTCSNCKSPWVPQHEGLSCEMFRKWQTENNPEYQNARLEHLLSRNKIDCPNCKFRFYLSKGGCLHFKCTQCQYEFCEGCRRPFKPGSACGFSADCGMKGLHAHHPRDCLYHLRDWNVPRLRQLLQHHKVAIPLQAGGSDKGLCGVLEQRETAQREEPCGKPAPAEYNGYCECHYKEWLVELINQKQLDPAALFDRAELVSELQRWGVRVPQVHRLEPEAKYLQRLRRAVRQIGLVAERALVEKAGIAASASCPTLGDQWARGLPPDSQLLLMLND
ncbi:E3 ubiquitin-protein ligase RNF31 isoform X2 [Anguilla anguilla]|uniref:E3 ubiquitin-protein ligase RNF31 isoform X2 n=1 Tax=Anguilla anguilla TaxID=7936 RepID=UPI0015B3216F|nr:E3 ubiquitin-protein ligase RNF31 isoform X2 [Anguilla anguilla]